MKAGSLMESLANQMGADWLTALLHSICSHSFVIVTLAHVYRRVNDCITVDHCITGNDRISADQCIIVDTCAIIYTCIIKDTRLTLYYCVLTDISCF